MTNSTAISAYMRQKADRVSFFAALTCLFVGAQFALANSTSLDCSHQYSDWQGGVIAWNQRMIIRVSKTAIGTLGSIANIDTASVLKSFPEGC